MGKAIIQQPRVPNNEVKELNGPSAIFRATCLYSRACVVIRGFNAELIPGNSQVILALLESKSIKMGMRGK